jgi:hypothetical protein
MKRQFEALIAQDIIQKEARKKYQGEKDKELYNKAIEANETYEKK